MNKRKLVKMHASKEDFLRYVLSHKEDFDEEIIEEAEEASKEPTVDIVEALGTVISMATNWFQTTKTNGKSTYGQDCITAVEEWFEGFKNE